ncbi:glycosyltransferase family 4 protein [Paracoccus aerodenitrificans]|uniref:glycosyltransferase family 4 protein n=1 Tax=Paracoccus aerodenitrificans TaxID=3017781 RepID=UPI0022F0D240|nr:glycosyltransferase family 4 protein [Paracoccus aerodenitrificans]WBU63454.1 glycosyltransferase family 4 protein [Paracoccus aerodenitrificans]
MTAIRILFPFAGDTGLGGSHVSALGLISALDRTRFHPHILLHQQAGAVGEHAHRLGLDFEVIEDLPLMKTRNNPRPGDIGPAGYLTWGIRRLMAEIKRLDPHIVHTNEGRIHANWALPARLCGCKHLWHHRQDPTAFGVNKIAPLLSDHIASVSWFSKPSRPIRSVDHMFSVIRSPFDFGDAPDADAARQMILSELDLPENTVLLGWFGLLTARKKPLRFVEAVAQIRKALPYRPVHGLMFGEISEPGSDLDRQCRDRAERLGIAGNLHLMGFRRPIADYMAGVDLNIVTALSEPFGRTLIESMDFGTPVIATAHGGNPEAIDHGTTGYLVEPETPAAFVEPALTLIRKPSKYRTMVKAARADVRGKYGRDVHVRLVSELYEKLVNPEPVKG